MSTDINRRLTALEHASRNTLACPACAPQRGHAYCWHTMPEPFRSLVAPVHLGDDAGQWREAASVGTT
jgi:hypothetical protein